MDFAVTTVGAKDSVVSFKLPRGRNLPLTGLLQLAQQYAFLLLKSPNRDPLSIGIGGGLVDQVRHASSGADIQSLCQASVGAAESQMKQFQGTSRSTLSKNERLSSATLKNVEFTFDAGTSAVKLSVLLTSQALESVLTEIDTRGAV